MPWERTCEGRNVYSTWEADGVTWTIEDLEPEVDDQVIELMTKYFLPEAPMASRIDFHKDERNVEEVQQFWKYVLSQRSSLICFRHDDDEKTIAAVNLCPVKSIDDIELDFSKIECKGIQMLVETLNYLDNYVDLFNALDVTQYLSGCGLMVVPRFRGSRIGAKVLAAREPLCRKLGVRGTATLFTGPASQSLATRCGFVTLFKKSFAELAEAGYHYPGDQDSVVKMMILKYVY